MKLSYLRFPLAAFAFVALVLAVHLIFPRTLPKLPVITTHSGTQQLTAAPVTPDLDEVVKALLDENFWGTKIVASNDAPLTPPDWRIVGVYERDGKSYAVVSQLVVDDPLALLPPIPGVPPPSPKYNYRHLTVGDALPGGATILGINPDYLCIRLNGHARKLKVYRE
ncbi:MAG: hypothetical protein JO142_10035 [Burkholderiales bacterium]|nr:hypothetical protein [Burkholderiales bacterium]